MAIQTTYPALETLYSSPLLGELDLPSNIALEEIKSRAIFPKPFLKELENFCIRNSWQVQEYNPERRTTSVFPVCSARCLKAHAINLSKQLDLGEDAIMVLEEVFPCETGHSGYYEDEGKLIELQS